MTRKIVLLAVALAMGGTSVANAQATRTWVSGVGDDANPCSRTAPCKTWAGAISKTMANGEMSALDSGGFGAVTIVKGMTIDGGGVHASILASGTHGIIVNAPGADVVLRDLSLQGVDAGHTAVRIFAARSVVLEDVDITGWAQDAIAFAPTAATATTLTLDRVRVSDVGGDAVRVGAADASSRTRVMVRDSRLIGARGSYTAAGPSGAGVTADTGAEVWLTGTTIFDNAVGTRRIASFGDAGIIRGYCDNQIGGNADDGMEPTRLCPDPPPQTTTNNTHTNTVVQQPAPAPVERVVAPAPTCLVPELVGLSLSAAARGLKASGCALGQVRRRRAPRAWSNRVRSQAVRGGQRRPAGSRIAVTTGKR